MFAMSVITQDLLNLSSGPAFIGSLIGLFTGGNSSAGIYAFGDSLSDAAVANPARFGLTNVTDPVWTGNYNDPNSGTLASTNSAVQNQYLFWDHLHPTAHGHEVLGAHAVHALYG